MKRLIIIMLICSPKIMAQSMEELFVKMPNKLIVSLEEAWRKDLVNLYKSGATATLENTMQGKSSLLKLTDDYLLLQSTTNSMIELKRLPLVNNTHIICMITTVMGTVADSRVDFYTTEWLRLPSQDIFEPVTENWFWKENIQKIAPYFVKYALNEAEYTLTAEYMTPLYIDEESRKNIQPLLKNEPKTYTWKLSRFE